MKGLHTGEKIEATRDKVIQSSDLVISFSHAFKPSIAKILRRGFLPIESRFETLVRRNPIR
jgi:hypothetical protein